MKKLFSAAVVLISIVMLSACGGGGGGGAASYTVGGSVSGLSGSGLVLQNNGADDLAVSADGAFTFATSVADGSAYLVTVKTQPSGPLQTCTASSNTGTIAGANVTNVSVVCSTNAYTVGGTISNLTGNGLVLQDNGADDLSVAAGSTSFTFATKVADGAGYHVTLKTRPADQNCTIGSSNGTIAGANITNVSVNCFSAYTVGGTVSGLSGSGLVLQNNGGDDLAVSANGTFIFVTPVASGAGYDITVKTQPAGQTCTVGNGTGTITGADINNVTVTCLLNTGNFVKETRITVTGGISGPWSGSDDKVQLLYPADQVNGSGNIKAIRFQLASDNSSTVTCPGTTIKLGHTNATALTTTFANNLAGNKGSFVTVLNNATVTITAGTTNSWFEVPFTTTFNYNGVDNLLVQVDKIAACSAEVFTNRGSVANVRAESFANDTDPGTAQYNATTASYVDNNLNTLQFVFAGGADAVIRTGSVMGCNWPFTDTPLHVQTLHLSSELNGSGPITGIGMVAGSTTVASAYTMTVKLGHTFATSLSNTFAANFKDSPVTVASAMTFTIPAGNPVGSVVWLPLTGAFTYNGTDNLIVDIQVDAGSGNNAWRTKDSGGANMNMWGAAGAVTGNLSPYAFDTVFRFNGGTIDVLAADFTVNLNGSNQVFGTATSGTGGQVQSLFDSTLLGTGGTINSISLRLYNNSSTATSLTNFKVYMGHTTKTGYTVSDTYASDMNNDPRVVFSGGFNIPAGLAAGDWITIPLQTPFTYDPSKNLSILFTSDNDNGGATSLNVVGSFTDATRFPNYAVGRDDNAVSVTDNPLWSYPGGVCVRLGITR